MLPIFQSAIKEFQLLQNRWSSELNPFLAVPSNMPSTLTNIVLASGSNVISHKLGRTPSGWQIIDRDAAATIYRSAPFNDLTLTLTASGAVTVSLMVF